MYKSEQENPIWQIVITNEKKAHLCTLDKRTFSQVEHFLESIKGTECFGYVRAYSSTEKYWFHKIKLLGGIVVK